MVVNDFTHLIWSICICCDTGNEFAISSCHLFAVGQIAGARYVTGIDGVSDDHIKSLFGRGGSKAPATVSE
jgi:hypothetical protein